MTVSAASEQTEFPTDDQTWDLEKVFAGGPESEEYREHVEATAQAIEALIERAEQLPRLAEVDPSDAEAIDKWVGFFSRQQEVGEAFHEAMSFARCTASAHASDPKAAAMPARLQELSSRLDQVGVDVMAAMRGVDEAVFERLLDRDELADLQLHIEEMRRDAERAMDPQLEGLAAELNRDGLHAWGDLYDRISGQLTVEIADPEEGERREMSVGQAKNILAKEGRERRRAAFDGLQTAWSEESSTIASILNSIVGSEQTLYDRRGLDVLTEPLDNNRIERETLEAMMQAADEVRPALLDYLELKAEAMGVEQLEWFDLRAPVGTNDGELEWEEAQSFIAEQIDGFSGAMGDFYRQALANQWVEAEDRSGKAQGGFCITFPQTGEQRIFMTYGGSMSSVLTLAHELGHAYHGWLMRDLPPAARHVPMTLAESASTLSEKLVESAALDRAADEQQLYLLDERLQRSMAFLVDIPARFRLEKSMHQARRDGPLGPKMLCEMTGEVYGEAFGDRLASLDRFHWASKLHYYITRMPFYNFPYLFGYLFSKALYNRARQQGSEFAGVIDDLLRDSGQQTAEELAADYLDADLTDPSFWLEAAGSVRADVARYRELVEEVG
jgi:pepF/M3 family oligoendopeptidase